MYFGVPKCLAGVARTSCTFRSFACMSAAGIFRRGGASKLSGSWSEIMRYPFAENVFGSKEDLLYALTNNAKNLRNLLHRVRAFVRHVETARRSSRRDEPWRTGPVL